MINKIVFLFIFCFFVISGLSQTDSVYNFLMPELKITQTENDKLITYNFDNDINRFTLNGNTLRADTVKYRYNVSIQDILSVSIRSGNHFWKGAGIGAAIGFIAGVMLWGNFSMEGSSSDFSVNNAVMGGVITALPIGLIFGLLGSLSPTYEDFIFYNKDLTAKRRDILNAFRKWHGSVQL